MNTEYMTVSCDCKVKANITNNETSENLEKLENIKTESSFGIIKCYKLVFSFDGKLNNFGCWIFLILIFIYFPFLIYYFLKGTKKIKDYLIREMTKNGYIKENSGNIHLRKRASKRLDNKQIINLKRRKSKIHSPPKNIKINKEIFVKAKTINKKRKSKKYNIHNLQIIDGSSINNIQSSNKEESNIINNINDNINNSNKKINKFRRRSILKKKGKLFHPKQIDEESQKNIDTLQTQGSKEKSKKSDNKKNNNQKDDDGNNYDFNLININLNNIIKFTPIYSKHELNNYTFEEAIKYDMRTICVIFYIFLLSKEAAFHAFLYRSPLELFPLRFSLFLFIIANDLALNSFFYFEDKISEKYNYTKNLFLFTFNNNLTIIILSTVIGLIIITVFINLSNSSNAIRKIFLEEERKINKDKNYFVTEGRKKEIIEEIEKILKRHKIKVILIIIIQTLLIMFYWYYVTAFCHIYSSTQLSWLLNSFLSILSRFIIVLILSLGFAKLYRLAIESNIHCIYKIVLFFYSFA